MADITNQLKKSVIILKKADVGWGLVASLGRGRRQGERKPKQRFDISRNIANEKAVTAASVTAFSLVAGSRIELPTLGL